MRPLKLGLPIPGPSCRVCQSILLAPRSTVHRASSSTLHAPSSRSVSNSTHQRQLEHVQQIPACSIQTRRAFSISRTVLADVGSDGKRRKINMEQFPPERIRNLSIIAHIDHGKSTLADRLLQMTNTLPPSSSPQFLDKLKVERERGITVKAQTVSIIHTHTDGHKYLINLIDTPGHVDFSYEVSRSLGACEGGLLLVDCTQGIQAQTLSVFHHAVDADLTLLPVINKVDLPHASPAATSEQIESSLGLPQSTHMPISAKSGMGVDKVLSNIIESLPPPTHDESDTRLRALVFDTFYDRFRGVVSLVRLFSGSLKKGDKVKFLQAGRKYDVLDVGIYNPEEVPVDELRAGQVGYLVCNMKNSDEAFIGDTVCLADKMVEPLPGSKPMKAMVFAGVFPMESADFPQLEESIERLTLNDRSVSVERETSAALGQGYRLGFLGTLHMDVFRQRLEDEYSSNVIVTAPTVPYKVIYHGDKEVFISNPAEFPDVTDTKSRVIRVEEPMVNATIFVPTDYLGEMMDLCARYRGVQQEYRFLEGTDRAILRYSLPLSEIVTDFFSELKSASSGFASFDYEEAGYEASDLVRLNMMLNGKPVDALAMIVHKSVAANVGRSWAKKLKDVLPRQLFELAIQAAVGHKVVARETLSAVRKDVTAGLYGGHYERKLKHLNKQKEGKRRLKRLAGNIDIPQSAFFEVLSSRPRSFSTSAIDRRAHLGGPSLGSFLRSLSTAPVRAGSSLDPGIIISHLPSVPAQTSGETIKSATPVSLGSSHVAPLARSKILSTLHRQITSSNKTSAEAIYETFTRLYLASPTQQFTPTELLVTARAMNKLDRLVGVHKTRAAERLNTIVNVLQDLNKEGESALKSLSFIRVVSLRHRRLVTPVDLNAADSIASSTVWQIGHHDTMRRGRLRAAINNMLYTCALARNPTRFEKWWDRLRINGFKPDSPALLARLMLLDQTRDLDGIKSVIGNLDTTRLGTLTQPTLNDPVILLNYAMLALARRGAWDWVGSIYAKLRPHAPLVLPSPAPLPNLAGIDASRNTYSVVIDVLAYRGDLLGALAVLGHMAQDGFAPGVEQYGSLFRGFARFTPVRLGVAGEATTAFPMYRNFTDEMGAGLGGEGVEGEGEGSVGRGRTLGLRSLTEIWDRDQGAFTSNLSTNNPWTSDALADVLSSFLSLAPATTTAPTSSSSTNEGKERGLNTRNARRAPSRKVVYNILLAFARATNGDAAVLREVWDALETKFGTAGGSEERRGEGEGWEGWAVDGRLERIRQTIFAEIVKRE